jgi:glycosyltransferase involved in cell wall biosynthesis
MSFLVVTHVEHIIHEGRIYAYGPYVQEMNIWFSQLQRVVVLGTLSKEKKPGAIHLPYQHDNIELVFLPSFHTLGVKARVKAIGSSIIIFLRCLQYMAGASHIHLRCPGNVGLIGCLAQLFFPWKKKTAKYAGNWDRNSHQPIGYRLQQSILRNSWITRNMKVLVYGDWKEKSRNILPFFTASYSETEVVEYTKPALKDGLRIAFLGSLTPNKNPLLCLEVVRLLKENGHKVKINFCGDGPLRNILEERTRTYSLEEQVLVHGNVDREAVKNILQQSHFLILASRSEGWPKAVAEAMFWGAIPFSTAVSCVHQMIGKSEERGFLVNEQPEQILQHVIPLQNDPTIFEIKSRAGMEWSRKFTREKFESEIQQLLN